MKLKEQLKALAAFLIAVVLIIISFTVDLQTIRSWVFGTRIIVSSSTRGEATEYFAGEVLKLSLERVRSPRVFWAFDEAQPVAGAVEAEYAFTFDTAAPSGQVRDRRVDAFFKSGDSYKTATTLVRTRNTKYTVTVKVDESQMVLTAPATFGADWSLTGASLAFFAGGRLTKRGALRTATAATGDEQFVATRREAQAAFGYSDTTHLASELKNDSRAWTWYDFTNKATGARLTIAKPVTVAAQE